VLLLLFFENCVKIGKNDLVMCELMARTAEALSDGDLVDATLRASQSVWLLLLFLFVVYDLLLVVVVVVGHDVCIPVDVGARGRRVFGGRAWRSITLETIEVNEHSDCCCCYCCCCCCYCCCLTMMMC
jgi:hypothetical protein